MKYLQTRSNYDW